MRLVQMKVRGFRGFQDEVVLDIGALTAIVGANDAGKSTLLEALGAFFGEQKLDQDDVCVFGDTKEMRVACVFDELPDAVIVDRLHRTSLADEYLVRADGRLEVIKTWTASSKPKESISLVANHPRAAEASDLLSLANGALKMRLKKVGAEHGETDLTVNAAIRARIRDHVGDLQLDERELPLDGDVWKALEPHLPRFALFKSDRTSSDQDDEAQDPMRQAVKEAVAALEGSLRTVTEQVEKEVRAVADATLSKLRESWPEVASALVPTIKLKPWDSVFTMSLTSDEDVPLNKRGSGVRRLVLFSFFRAKVEQRFRSSGSEPSVVYAIEEPETSQHPSNQRRLLDVLQGLTDQPGCQVLFTTHTPSLVAPLPTDCLRYVSAEGGRRTVKSGSDFVYQQVATALGVMPDHRVRVFLMLEGANDINFLRGISKILNAADASVPCLQTLEDAGLVLPLPLGGSTLQKWVAQNLLRELRRPELHIYDRDSETAPPYAASALAVEARGDGSRAFLTTKREMESYLHPDAIRDVRPDLHVAFNDWHDLPEMVARAQHEMEPASRPWEELPEKRIKEKCSTAKRWLNTHAVEKMTPERLHERDPGGDVRLWLTTLAQMAGT